MDAALVMKTALALLTLAALGGLVMAGICVIRDANPPGWLALSHGLIAGSALVLLLYGYFTAGLPALARWALLILLLVAPGGAFLHRAYHAKGRLLPFGIVLAHGGIAVLGYAMLMTAFLLTLR